MNCLVFRFLPLPLFMPRQHSFTATCSAMAPFVGYLASPAKGRSVPSRILIEVKNAQAGRDRFVPTLLGYELSKH
jgi:hypothetical protein